MAIKIKQLVSRYFCPTHTNLRVVPYDKMERVLETLAPVEGKKGPILLASANNTRSERGEVSKFGYCWLCEDFVEGIRVTQHELVLRYMERPNFQSRRAGTRLFTPQNVERELVERREARG